MHSTIDTSSTTYTAEPHDRAFRSDKDPANMGNTVDGIYCDSNGDRSVRRIPEALSDTFKVVAFLILALVVRHMFTDGKTINPEGTSEQSIAIRAPVTVRSPDLIDLSTAGFDSGE